LQEFFAREFRVRVSVHVCKMGVFFCPFPVRPG
jgi:hypothetical protein